MNDTKQEQHRIFSETACKALKLADALDGTEEQTLGPTDVALCTDALRAYAAQVEAGFALVAPCFSNERDHVEASA